MDKYMTCRLEDILKNALHIAKLSVRGQGEEFWEKDPQRCWHRKDFLSS